MRAFIFVALVALAGQVQGALLATYNDAYYSQTMRGTAPGIENGSFGLSARLHAPNHGVGAAWGMLVAPADFGKFFSAPSDIVDQFDNALTGNGVIELHITQHLASTNDFWTTAPWKLGTAFVPQLFPGEGFKGYRITGIEGAVTSHIERQNFDLWSWENHSTIRIHGEPIPAVPGDFNQNGEVDAADYVLWRNRNGTDGSLPNESGQTPLDVMQEDYEFWRAQFGHAFVPVSSALGLGSQSVPEPTTWFLLLLSKLLTPSRCRQNRRRRCV